MKTTKFSESQMAQALKDNDSGQEIEVNCQELGITRSKFIARRSTVRLFIDYYSYNRLYELLEILDSCQCEAINI